MPLIIRNSNPMLPRNNGSVNIARSAIDQTLPRALRQYENALAVDSTPVTYYRRRNGGLKCSCQGAVLPNVMAVLDMEPGVAVLDAKGVGTQDYVQSMLQGSVFSIDRYGSRPQHFDGVGGDNPQRSVPHSPLVQSGFTHNKSTDLDDPFAEQIEDGSVEDLFDTGVENNLAIATATAGCAVCLGTGWVGGYDPSNALRLTYDARASWQGDFIADASTAPARLTLFGARVLEISVFAPSAVIGLEALRVWSDKTAVSDLTIEAVVAGVARSITSGLAAGSTTLLRITLGESVSYITHLEVQFELSLNPVYANFSRLSYSENLQLPENLDSANLVISPSLPHVQLYDIVADGMYRRLWKITAVNPAIDRERQINGWEATARILQSYELSNLLPKRRTRVHYKGNVVRQQPRSGTNHNPYQSNQQGRLR